jgi:hypothetical protein
MVYLTKVANLIWDLILQSKFAQEHPIVDIVQGLFLIINVTKPKIIKDGKLRIMDSFQELRL